MTAKEKFLALTYERLKAAVSNISDLNIKNIYALSFYYYAEEDDSRFASLIVSYNTTDHYQNEIKNASSEMEAKWSYAFWLQDEIEKIGGADDKALKNWFKETPYFYSEEENEEAFDDDNLFEDLMEKGGKFESEFIQEIIHLTKRLFDEKVVEKKFQRNIPILIHDHEYYEDPINWSKQANPPEPIQEFLNAYNSRFL